MRLYRRPWRSGVLVVSLMCAVSLAGSRSGLGAAQAAVSTPSGVLAPVQAELPAGSVPGPRASATPSEYAAATRVSATDAWAVGWSFTRETALVPLVEHGDGTAWHRVHVPSPKRAIDTYLLAVTAVSANDVWVAGSWTPDEQHFLPLTEHWDGTRWTVVSVPHQRGVGFNSLYGLTAVGPDDVWAAGLQLKGSYVSERPLVEHWDGTSWSIVATPKLSGVRYSVATSMAGGPSGQVIFGGWTQASDLTVRTLVERWDGTGWRRVHTPNSTSLAWSEVTALHVVGPSDVWAVGFSNSSDQRTHRTLVEHWDGSRWSLVPSPHAVGRPGSLLWGIDGTASNDLWAVGDSELHDALLTSYTLVEHWDGTRWTILHSPNVHRSTGNVFSSVVAFAPDDAFAFGDYAPNNGLQRTLLEHWDGASWSRE